MAEADRSTTANFQTFEAVSRSFALQVNDDSMDDGSGSDHCIPKGHIVSFDPALAPLPNNIVIATYGPMSRSRIGKLISEDGRWFLKAANESYPMIEIADPKQCVMGVATHHHAPGFSLLEPSA